MRKFAVIRPRSIGSDTSLRGYGGSAESIRIAVLIRSGKFWRGI
jgi:hypothetical protein